MEEENQPQPPTYPRPNLTLRYHMEKEGLSEERLAGHIGRDARTVRRWLDGERMPQPGNAREAARVLGAQPQDIWPDIFPTLDPPSGGTVAVSTYSSRALVPVQVWRDHFATAVTGIDICVYGGTFLFDSVPGFARLLTDAVRRGVAVRVLVGDPDATIVQRRGAEVAIDDELPARCRLTVARLSPLAAAEGIQLRTHRTTLYAPLFRADDTLIANHHVYGSPASVNPAFVIERDADPELWATYLTSFELIWTGARPVTDHGREGP